MPHRHDSLTEIEMVEIGLMEAASRTPERHWLDDASVPVSSPGADVAALRDASGERSVWEWLSRSIKLPAPTLAR